MSSKTCIYSFFSCCMSCISRAHLANIFLWTAGILCSISIVYPFWLIKEAAQAYMFWTIPRKHIGLLCECHSPWQCTWVWENRFKLQFDMEEWRRVVQGLFLSGLLLLLPVLLMSPFRFCCQCGRMSVRLSRVFAIFTFLSTCIFGSAAIYFFYVVIWSYDSVSQTLTRVNSWSWAFEVGVAGTCFTFISSIFWYLDSRRKVGTVTVPNQHQNELNLDQR